MNNDPKRVYEPSRRVVIRLATTVLMMIVGPSAAWLATGIGGLITYILAVPISTMFAAEFASRTSKFASVMYSISPLFLLIAGLLPILFSHNIFPVLVVPCAIGIYQGSFWCSYHGIRKGSRTEACECEGQSTDRWQKLEIFTTFCFV